MEIQDKEEKEEDDTSEQMEAEAEQNFLVIKEKVLARNYNESQSKDFIMQNIVTPY